VRIKRVDEFILQSFNDQRLTERRGIGEFVDEKQ
jgi:hypothetical protein